MAESPVQTGTAELPYLVSNAPAPASTVSPTPVAAGAPPDLGFGAVVAQQARGRFLERDGTPQARKFGLGSQTAARFYIKALSAPWPAFLLWSVGALLLVNGAFALLWRALGPQAIVASDALGVRDPFLRALAFSTGIFTTTGTAGMHAAGDTAHLLQIIEGLLGPLTLMALGGLVVARLTRPRARVRFTERMVVAPYRGGRALMFRVVNVNPSELSDVNMRVNLAMFQDVNGRRERRFYQLPLERANVEFFTLHWTVVHPIDEKSPLRGLTAEQFRASQAEVLILMHAHEEVFSTRVTARTSYLAEDVRFDAKWADVFVASPDGVITIDVERLDRMDRLADGTTSVPAERETVAV
jgi:inward rectifier potassium channel